MKLLDGTSRLTLRQAPQLVHATRPSRARPATASPATAAAARAAATRLRWHSGRGHAALAQGSKNRRCSMRCRGAALRVTSLVNVDLSPSVILGVGLIFSGLSLVQVRRVKPWISKDYDIVVSSIGFLVGGILIFQGWRLDPLLLFGQLLTTGAALSFAVEALRLRSEQYESEEKAALQEVSERPPPGGGGGAAFQLPPAEQQVPPPWADGGAQQWQQQPDAGFYDYQQPASGSGFDPQQQQQQQYGSTADGQWYYGGQYQVADYEVPDGTAAGTPADPFLPPGDGLSGSAGPSGTSPAEFVFPTSYGDSAAGPGPSTGSANGSSSYGEAASQAPGQQQQQEEGQAWQQQWGQQQQQQQPPLGPGRGSGYEMDDW
ncbi:hypothetical protein ACK3TF_000449 [Chlorella vulgaris]